ncbi:hypothetical protein QGM71_07415 [Virgibacillus sp. C22-A2]|uniref:Uncharacterized protein n=1 Tax=Virgibacillus tibetensis TaxID=3042313 RepID=A0ABU6KE12_9BACI|nr:hypothetical protein [Virgibacillus sp. C22-A2]
MKKVIEGSVYNTETAKKICERSSEESNHEKGAVVKQLQQLYKTKSNKFFFYVKSEFTTHVVVNNDDIDPRFEDQEVTEEKIIPVSYEEALQFSSEISAVSKLEKKMIAKYFPEIVVKESNDNKKIQKKLYLSEKANWYLELMLQEGKETNSSFVEKLITEEYQRLYKKGLMVRDPFFEMEE